MNRHRVAALLSTVVFIAGCGASEASLASAPSARPTPGAPAGVTPTQAASPTATSTPRSTASPVPAQTPFGITVDSVAVTLVDGLRVRSKPSVSDDSFKYPPLLPHGTPLYVLGGPIVAADYTWYQVIPLASRRLPQGWVAGASRSGDPWLGKGDFACPPVPTDLRSLAALPSGVGLACFPRRPITIRARLIECNCEMDGPWYTPGWFFLGSGSPKLLVEPTTTHPPADAGTWFVLKLDPAGQHPDVLPVGKVVEATGLFDHPAAAGCTVTEMDGNPVPTQDCRLAFAVTKLVTRP